MDYQYLVVSEESLFHRARRQALEYISGYSTYRSKFTLGNREMTSTESQDGTGEFLRLRSSADDYISSTLQQAFPNRPIQIGITKLSTPHTTVEFEIQIHDDVDLNDTRKQLAKALDALDKADSFQLDSRTYSVEEVMLGKEGGDDSTLEYTICILCSDYQTCTQTNGVWTCQLSDPRLYSFGSVQQDSSMVKNVDYATVQLKVPDAITWGEEEVSNIWVSVNGFISLDSQFVSYIPRRLPMNSQKLLAVYWSDLELKSGDVGEVYYQIYSKYGRKYDPNIFKKANEDVKSYTGDESYDATSVIVVTWSDMAPYPLYRSETERVTFQCTIITDGTTTYAVYHYGHGAMRFNAQLRRPVEAGWGGINLDSSRVNYYNFDQNLGNTGVVGKWFFQIGRRENYKAKCLNWYYKNLQDYENIRFWDIVLPKCPCNEFFVWATGWWQMSNQNGVSCYESYNSYTPYGRVCCYRLDDWQLNWSSLSWMFSAFGRTFGTFENRMPFAGSLQRNSPYYRGNYNYGYFNNPMFDTNRYSTQTIFAYMHEVDDLEPKQWCCYQSNLCHLYYQVRPASNCIGPNVAFGIGFGDPQINTLDNKWFIFNGLGKYRLLEITGKHPKNTSLSVDFKLQGRTCKAVTSSGESTNATVWCALALKTTSGNTTKIEISETGNNMIIYANGQDYSLRFRNSLNFSEVNKDIYLRKDSITESLMISTADGVGLTVSLKNKILVYTLDVDEMYKSMTRGLLSNFNDDPSDDFIFPNSTKLSNNASDRQIYDYGQTWAVTQDSSLFDYIYGQNTSDPSFMPLFLDQLNTTEAVIVCNDATHIACIFDYAVTRNPGIALLTKITVDVFANQVKLVGNSAPTITGNRDYNVTINQTLNIVLNCTDPDKDNLSVVVLSKPNQGFTYSLIDGQLSLSYTPSKITDESIELVVHDSAGLDSGVLKLNLTMCSGCSSHGHCDFADRLTVNTPYKAIARCVCDVGYTGDDCELDRDGCLMEPCPDQTKCQDLDVATERATGLSFKCTDCPKGYKLVNNDTKCEDIDECQNTSNACPAHANCQNTIGSFECNCGQGFRKYNGQCIDINECAEYQDDCAQICINELSTFTCDCYEGYRKYGIIGHDCIQREDVCKGLNLTCEYGCTNQSGVAECFCQHGKKLADDKRSCIDIDECQLNLCPQGCQNINGGFICTCFDGFHLSETDNLTCEACSDDKYGSDCKKLCYCRGRAMDCDAVRGCVECDSGWTGETCSQDVDECAASATTCPQDQICTNTNGSYICSCPTGYELTNGVCENINECVSIQTSLCSHVCIDTPGSFRCQCEVGFKSSTNGTCIDIDECSYSTSGCQHKCTNVESSHNCECFPGYRLLEDRRTCQKVVSPCQNLNISCSFGCSLINSKAQCFCPLGYILGSDNYTCYDIDECTVQGDHEDKCTDNCLNTPGSYNCSCPIGKALLPDQRTCEVCDAYHWGEDCSQDCACYPIGSDRCDPVVGCICKTGWAGVHCKTDVDECQSSKSECTAPSICVNLPGSYKCECPNGFQNVNNICVDIDECKDTKTCDHNCTNAIGSFHCTCFEGFKVDGAKCLDIDECAVPSLSKCDQLCRNAPGGFACECLDGYSLNMTTRTTCVLSETAKACNSSSLCNQICTVVDDKDVCSCHLGYKLNSSNNVTCMDINECSGSNPCSSGQCNNIDGSFYCTCPAGYKLTSDQLTCQECEEGYYGTNCNSSCQCTSTNTVSCNTTDGSCVCKPGWQGQDCSVDINECSTNGVCYNNSQCINSQGSYKCVCATGYLSTGSSCNACDVNRYGQDCAQTCTCNFANTLDCHHTTGQCNCKPGWEGVNCDQDINECSNSSYCSGSFVQCINLNGSAECRCLSGYERPTNSSTCQDINECENSLLNNCLTPSVCNNTWGSYECVCMKGFHNVSGQCSACDSLHYGTNCAMDCQCHVNNTLDCDDINGTCTCRHGWTGQKCDLDVDECTQNASFCSSINETCTNLNGSAECLCNIGFYKAAFNESCRACGSLYYGLNCASQCSCNATNTEDCNDINGTCSCKSGWTGPICNQACNSTQYGPNCASQCLCNATNTEDCNDVNGTCSCKSGWTGDNCNQACNSTQYGPNCASQCLCNATNTEDCNDVNGTCSCKPGWTGPICNQACNSTQYGPNCASQCLCNATNTEDCNDVNGTCSCKPGWIGANCNQACNSTQYGPNCASQCLCNATNTEDCNDVNGTCFCKSGWTGANCNQGKCISILNQL
uniref:protein disulfide-isomerase n=1 Tax=Biomphalaria glabrata TaxID=6526 RepID=A0A2C9JE73_BIOGL